MSKYEALPLGLRKLGNSPGVSKAVLDVAERMAGNANAVGDSKYEAATAKVTAGWDNEERAGAVVREVEHDWEDSRDAILLRVADAMRRVRKR
ncbi:hypothetical protein [Pseudarthrobacter sp. LT1]|uniref:hypothetical protein n=1 Tax=Pseudarthrobacter sp. LT1 TaxID=3111450 RepID=UPI002D77E57C|nr:hypothetical protein [Pseudarthrobacter sp. LT1]WRT14660.1 hypothetical protein VIK36_03970 [Pseudarthrobacter sp. LT1]